MVYLRVKRGRNMKNHRHGDTITTIKSLPTELLVEIIAKVASHSLIDLCNMKLCCKEFLHVAEDDYVYHHVSMEKFPLVPHGWFQGKRESFFLKRCGESGNSEMLYREGMVQYFSSLKLKRGLENLKKATIEGHDEAKYVYCMILMSGKGEDERKQGFDLLCSLKGYTCVRRCRKRVKSFIKSLWLNNKPVFANHKFSLLCRSGTCDGGKLKNVSRSSWVNYEDGNDIDGLCDYCSADYELGLFSKMFEG
ncbi:hypothetical protein RJT34_32242 [Clitoria ternatea]|uniref:F-box domain-containing protein n=1 Tax=Clitoria ternatea TaxID=43366 RepID=A0AAN9F3J7_CLITE